LQARNEGRFAGVATSRPLVLGEQSMRLARNDAHAAQTWGKQVSSCHMRREG